MSLIGNWSQDMILMFNSIGDYCQRNAIQADELERMFNAGIVARDQGRLGDFAMIYDDPQIPVSASDDAVAA